MGMTIEDIILELEEAKNYPISNEAVNYALDTIHKYLLMQSDYENRLKADLIAILTEIQLEIEEIKPLEPTDWEDWQLGCFHGLELMQDKCLRIIQQKINALKSEE